jgi:hypothetical protein
MVSRSQPRQARHVPHDHAVSVTGDGEQGAVAPPRAPAAVTHAAQELVAIPAGGLGPRRADPSQGVRIASCHGRQLRRGSPARGHPLDQPVVLGQHRAVAHLQGRHRLEQPEVHVERRRRAIEMEQMIEREKDPRFAQPRRHVEHVPPEPLHIGVQPLGHPVDPQVHFEVAVRQPARHLLADDDVRGVRSPIEQFERAVDRVMVGDRDQIHSTRFRQPIHRLRPRVTVAGAEKRHVPILLRMAGVDVHVGAKRGHPSGFNTSTCSVEEPTLR